LARWFVRRLLAAIVVLWAVSSIVFLVTNVFTDPASVSLPLNASEEQRQQRRENLGLDRPLVVQYGDFLAGLATFDIGDSFWQERAAYDIVLERLPNTLRLVGAGMAFSILLAVPLGILAVVFERRFPDFAVLGFSLASISAPPFWIAYLLIIIFAVNLGWVPTSGSNGWKALILPAVSIGLASAGRLAQMLHRAIIDELRQPYALTARSRGFSRRYTIVHHTFRNVGAAFATFSGWELTRMFTGYTVVIEVVFSWPGVGLLAFQSVEQKDLILLEGAVLMLAALVVITNFVIDLLRRAIDPRVELA
jgi:peptide/nickel transport system permease protein